MSDTLVELDHLEPGSASLQRAAELIRALSPDHTGVYLYGLEGDVLVLRAHVGRDSEHTRIPVGRGVCGRAVATGQSQVVDDVQSDPDYLACSLETRSEVVVLCRNEGGEIVGQIDIDGDRPSAFGPEAVARLESAALRVGRLFSATRTDRGPDLV